MAFSPVRLLSSFFYPSPLTFLHLSVCPSISLTSLSVSSVDSSALNAFSAVHAFVKREEKPNGGMARLVAQVQAMVEKAVEETQGRATEDHCSGWMSTLKVR
jgi:hypothetical protein